MSDDKKTKADEKKQPAWMTGPGGAQPIPVQAIRLQQGMTIGIYGNGAATHVIDESVQRMPDGEPQTNINRHKIYYLPWLGCYHVAFYRAGTFEPEKALMVPREWATWEPMK